MEDFKSNPKMQCFKEGGQVKYESRKEHAEEIKADIDQDKKIVKKAIAMHDKQEHKGEKTDLSKLNKGGRAKKAKGTVKKFKTGGEVTNVYEAKKASSDKDNIKKVKNIKATKLCGGGMAKYEGGGLVDAIKAGATKLKENLLGTEEQNKVAQANLDKQAAQGSKLAKMLGGQGAVTENERATLRGADKLSNQGAVTEYERSNINKKRGGKVC